MHTRLPCASKPRQITGYYCGLRARSFSPSDRSGIHHFTFRALHTRTLVPLAGARGARPSFGTWERERKHLIKKTLKCNVSVMATTTSGEDDDYKSKSQQSPLASQRAKETGQAKRTGRFTGYFPLGYKEGFSQWVRRQLYVLLRNATK
jgi:hypothetical protein